MMFSFVPNWRGSDEGEEGKSLRQVFGLLWVWADHRPWEGLSSGAPPPPQPPTPATPRASGKEKHKTNITEMVLWSVL